MITREELSSLPVHKFRESQLPGEKDLPHDVTWQQYHTVRNALLEALRSIGKVGPMGVASITDAPDGPPDPWHVENDDPDFLVLDDMWNDWERFVKIELKRPVLLTDRVVWAVWTVLATYPSWAVGIASEVGYLYISGGRASVKGSAFSRCRALGDVFEAASRSDRKA